MPFVVDLGDVAMRSVSGPYRYYRHRTLSDATGRTTTTTLAYAAERGPVAIVVRHTVRTSRATAALGAAYDRRRRARRRAARR